MTARALLPVDAALPALLDAVRAHGVAVLVAPPGAGKTTRVPGALLDAGLAGDGRVIVLQPRRVAARAAARRVAAERGGALGDEVGYRVRFDERTGPTTRIEFVTEALLTRRVQADPLLEGVGCVVFDEFHERSLDADLALALVAEARRALRPELALVVMSATLDAEPVAAWLDAPVVRAEGRVFPVEVRHAPRPDDRPAPVRAAAAARAALRAADDGHVLVFLPGVGEIERTIEALGAPEGVAVLPLHGRLSAEAQDHALAPSNARKIIVATNIAETSVTIEGVRAVVDSGLARAPKFDPAIGLERLELGRISRASAEQRAGRAGRTSPGVCLRLWTLAEQGGLRPFDAPEVTRVDLARACLEVRGWGADPRRFGWFEAPPVAAIDAAEALLTRLGALEDGRLTPLGRAVLALPAHPRLARVVIEGRRRGCLRLAATVAALAAERDVFREPPQTGADSDLHLRLDALARAERGRFGPGVNRRALAEVLRSRDQLERVAAAAPRDDAAPSEPWPADEETRVARLLLTGFPDRVAQRRAPGSDRFRLASGGGARLDAHSAVHDAPLVLAVALDGGRRGERAEHVIRSATALDPAWLPTTEAVVTRFDAEREAVVQVRERRYLSLVLDARPAGDDADAAEVERVLAEAVAADPQTALGWGHDAAVAGFVARVRWLAKVRPALGLPIFAELDPAETPGPLIVMLCAGARSFADLRRRPLLRFFEGLLDPTARRTVEALAPTRLTLPDGTTQTLEYPAEGPPVLATRFERLFGLAETPRVADVPVMLHLLAPNLRPVQVTRDLRSFWETTYPQVRRELRGRYPKHPWPEDPWTAPPGVRRQRKA